MPIMSKQLEDDFKICIDRVIEFRYEDDKIYCCVMDWKTKVLREMAIAHKHNSEHAKCKISESCKKCCHNVSTNPFYIICDLD